MIANDLLLSIIRAELGMADDEKMPNVIDDITLNSLYTVGKRHDIAHIVALWLSKSNIQMPEKVRALFRKELHLAIFRYERMNYDFRRICDAFECEKIPYIPLKGAVIRKYYPQPWIRTSCDIDILVKEEDLERAINVLSCKLSFKSNRKRDYHDVSMFSESNTHLELHFNIKENMKNVDGVLSDVWEYAELDGDVEYRYKLSNEFLLFHIISHMAYHIKCGGVGIRAFIDLYLLEKNITYDESELSRLCEKCSIETFRKNVEKLSGVWMEKREQDTVSAQLQDFVLNGGLYGDIQNAAAINQSKDGGRGKYLFSLIFQPYEVLKEKYPVLKKHKWLIFIYQVKRWFDIIGSNRRKNAVRYLKAGKDLTEKEVDNKIKLFKDLGIY